MRGRGRWCVATVVAVALVVSGAAPAAATVRDPDVGAAVAPWFAEPDAMFPDLDVSAAGIQGSSGRDALLADTTQVEVPTSTSPSRSWLQEDWAYPSGAAADRLEQEPALDDLGVLDGVIIEPWGASPAGFPAVGPPTATGVGTPPAPLSDADLQALLARCQSDLLRRGIVAHKAAEAFNGCGPGLPSGWTPRQLTEGLGGTYSNEVGQLLVGRALPGTFGYAACVTRGECGTISSRAAAAGRSRPSGADVDPQEGQGPTGSASPQPPAPAPLGTSSPSRSPVQAPVAPPVQTPAPAPRVQTPVAPRVQAPAAPPSQARGDERVNPLYAPAYGALGVGASYLRSRDQQPDAGAVPEPQMARRLLPSSVRSGLQGAATAGALPDVDAGDPLLSALANGCQAALLAQCTQVTARRVVNPALNAVADERRARAPTRTLVDPARVTLSPDPAVNIPPGRAPGAPPVDPSAFDEVEFRRSQGTIPVVRPGGYSDSSFRVDAVYGLSREGSPPGTAPGTGFSLADVRAMTPEQLTRIQRISDGTLVVSNISSALAGAALQETLKAAGQEDNYLLDVGAQSLLMGVTTGLPISLAQGQFQRSAVVTPTVQSAAARVTSDLVLAAAPEPVRQALIGACSDENPVRNVAEATACNLGEKPDQGAPPPTGGGAPTLAMSGVTSGAQAGPPAPTGADPTAGGQQEPGWRLPGGMTQEQVRAKLAAQVPVWDGLLRQRGIDARTADEVVNNVVQIPELGFHAMFPGLTGEVAKRIIGGDPGNDAVGVRLRGSLVGPRIVGPRIVGPRLVGPCTSPAQPCWGTMNPGPASVSAQAPSGVTPAPAVRRSAPAPAPSAGRSAPAPAVRRSAPSAGRVAPASAAGRSAPVPASAAARAAPARVSSPAGRPSPASPSRPSYGVGQFARDAVGVGVGAGLGLLKGLWEAGKALSPLTP